MLDLSPRLAEEVLLLLFIFNITFFEDHRHNKNKQQRQRQQQPDCMTTRVRGKTQDTRDNRRESEKERVRKRIEGTAILQQYILK